MDILSILKYVLLEEFRYPKLSYSLSIVVIGVVLRHRYNNSTHAFQDRHYLSHWLFILACRNLPAKELLSVQQSMLHVGTSILAGRDQWEFGICWDWKGKTLGFGVFRGGHNIQPRFIKVKF